MRCPRLVHEKRDTFSSFIKICLAEVRHNRERFDHFVIRSDAQSHAVEIDSNITPNSLRVLMRKT